MAATKGTQRAAHSVPVKAVLRVAKKAVWKACWWADLMVETTAGNLAGQKDGPRAVTRAEQLAAKSELVTVAMTA
jgi:hypothetical protein